MIDMVSPFDSSDIDRTISVPSDHGSIKSKDNKEETNMKETTQVQQIEMTVSITQPQTK